jgi:phosphohistidine phosphatase
MTLEVQMQLLVVRHGIAGERDPEASDVEDAERELTGKGVRRMQRGARGLLSLVPTLDLLASSPLVRARQTADILAEAYGGVEVRQATQLSPGEPSSSVGAWLDEQSVETAAVVGHEPGLSLLVSWLLSGEARSIVELKKGGACLLDLPAGAAAGTGTLVWLLQPGQLRRIGR